MYQQNEFTGYPEENGAARRVDYAHPEYYQAIKGEPRPEEIELDQAVNPYINPEHVEYYEAQPYGIEQANEYQGPHSLEGYSGSTEMEVKQAEEQGKAEGSGGTRRRRGWLGIGGLLAALGAWLLKLPSLLFALKFGLAGLTAFGSAFVYSIFFGWPFAIGLILQLFIHEMGHALVMKLKGIPVGGMIFVPMLGAAVTMKQMPKNARDEAEVGIAGPIAGALAASVCLLMALQPGAQPIWASLAYFGFFINLFNLIPVVPFDGGRVLAAIDRRIWIVGFLLLLGVQIWEWINGNVSIWLLLFVAMAAIQLWGFASRANTPETKAYYNVPLATRIAMSLLYFGLAAVLFLGMSMAHSMLPLP